MAKTLDGRSCVTIVDGTTKTGLFAPDGSMNVVEATGSIIGLYHPCGAIQVTPVDGNSFVGFFAIDGSMNVLEGSSRSSGATCIEVVSGSFGGAPASNRFLLEDGSSFLLLESGDYLLRE